MTNSRTSSAVTSILLWLALAPRAYPHAGHDSAPGEAGAELISGPIAISAEAKANLALSVEEAELRTIEKVLLVIGQIETIPNRSAAVSSRIAGRVTDLRVSEGASVKKGQPIVEVESRQLGDPPPRVVLTAPLDGIVMERHVVLGDAVEPNQHLLEIADLTEVYAEGHLFEGQVAQVELGQKVRIDVESYPKAHFEGTVDLISGALDKKARTLKVWVRVPNPDQRLRPNMRAELKVVTAEGDSVVAVPRGAVLGDAGNLFVFVQSDSDDLVYERRSVVIGMRDDRYVEMIEGVFPGDQVVTEGNYQLQYVTTRRPAAKTGSPGSATDKVDAQHDARQAATAIGLPPKDTWTSPWMLMGLGLSFMLLLNAVLMLAKRRPVARVASLAVNPPSESPRAGAAGTGTVESSRKFTGARPETAAK